MQKGKDILLEKLHNHLFSSENDTNIVFAKDEQEVVLRYRAAFTKWLSEPQLRDNQMIHYLKETFGIQNSQAYIDLSRIKALIGNVTNAGKEFQRHRATDMILRGYELAQEAESHLEVKQAMAMIRAGEALVRVHMLDKADIENIPWDDIIPLELEPSTDVSVIGRKRINNLDELQRKLREKYGAQPEDVPFIDLTEQSDPLDNDQ